MPFAIDTAQRRYFHEENRIELQEALSLADLSRLQALWSSHILGTTNSDLLYKKGRQWREADARQARLSLQLSQLAEGLWNERPLYIALDQVVTPAFSAWNLFGKLPSSKVLENLFSVQGTLGALAVSLTPSSEPLFKKKEETTLYSPGSVWFFKSGDKNVFDSLDPNQTWWIIVYGSEAMRYFPQDSDPLKEFFRGKGVAQGGKLSQAKLTSLGR